MKGVDDMLERIFINDIDVTDFRSHPRILELRFISTYDLWYREFGERTDRILIGLAEAFSCDISKLQAVANQSPSIRKMTKSDRARHVQEIVFMGIVWNETRFTVSSKYLKMSKRSLYAQYAYIPKNFLTPEWLAQLDTEVVTCGLKQYALEVERFLSSLETFRKVV